MTVSAASLGLTTNQFNNLLHTVAAVKARKLPVKAAYIVIQAKIVESGIRVLASANVPVSQRYPHDLLDWTSDGLGHDHASVGDLQQQTGYAWCPAGLGRGMNQTTMDSPNGWGIPTDAGLMNSAISTAKFLDALARHPWQSMSNWAAAQAVQGSAFSDGSNYRAQDARAQKYVNAVWNLVTPAEGSEMQLTDKIKNRLTNGYATVAQFFDQINATTYSTDKKVDALTAEVAALTAEVAALTKAVAALPKGPTA